MLQCYDSHPVETPKNHKLKLSDAKIIMLSMCGYEHKQLAAYAACNSPSGWRACCPAQDMLDYLTHLSCMLASVVCVSLHS
jgi:hypothetical protein